MNVTLRKPIARGQENEQPRSGLRFANDRSANPVARNRSETENDSPSPIGCGRVPGWGWSRAATAERTAHNVLVFLGLKLRILALKHFQYLRADFFAQIHAEQFTVADAAVVIEPQHKFGDCGLACDVTNQFVFFADTGSDDLFIRVLLPRQRPASKVHLLSVPSVTPARAMAAISGSASDDRGPNNLLTGPSASVIVPNQEA